MDDDFCTTVTWSPVGRGGIEPAPNEGEMDEMLAYKWMEFLTKSKGVL